jgi:flagellar hook-associated protein 2
VALAYDPVATVTRMARSQAAASATGTLNGLTIKSNSNTLTDVIDGMTLTFKKVTAAAIPISAEQDNTAIRKTVDSFVTAYNDLNKLVADQTRYDSSNTKRDNLQGDSAAIAMRVQLRAMLAQTSGSSTTLKRAADIGLDVQTDGSIKVNEAKLASGLANVAELQKLFGNVDTVTPANNGLGVKMRNLADQFLSTDGTLKTRSEGLQKRIDLNRDRQDRLSDRIADTEKRLRAQYTALDRQMATLSGLSGYVAQQFGSSNSNG